MCGFKQFSSGQNGTTVVSCRLHSKPETPETALTSTHLYLHDRSPLNFFLGFSLHPYLAQPHAGEEAPRSRLGRKKGKERRGGEQGVATGGVVGRLKNSRGFKNKTTSRQFNQPISLAKEEGKEDRAGTGDRQGGAWSRQEPYRL